MLNAHVMLNFLGVPIDDSYVRKLRDGNSDQEDLEYRMIQHVLGLEPKAVPIEYVERYARASTPEVYIAVFPHTDRIFERFITPLRSAKRCYCLGEYLAAIELSAHVGEMLAMLIWQMTDVRLNGKPIDAGTEKALFGREFEKLGQEQRVDVLTAFGAITPADAQLMDFLRSTRRAYFHFWTANVGNMEDDALRCFKNLALLIKNVLQIQFNEGALSMNPKLLAYIAKHPLPLADNAAQ